MADVERGDLEEIGDRARDVDRERGPSPAGQRRQRLADGEDAHLARGGLEVALRTARRESRTSAREVDGATTITRCPRPASSSDMRATKVLTS